MSTAEKRIRELENLTDALARSQKQLLTAQIILNGRQGSLEEIVTTLAGKIDAFIEEGKKDRDAQKEERDQIRERMKHFDERVDKLVIAIGKLIENRNGKGDLT